MSRIKRSRADASHQSGEDFSNRYWTFSNCYSRARLRRAGAVLPRRGSCSGRGQHAGVSWTIGKVPRRRPPGSWGVSPLWDGSLARRLRARTHGAGRCRRAVTPHPPPALSPAVTHSPGWPRLREPPGRPPAPGILPSCKDHQQGHCGLRRPRRLLRKRRPLPDDLCTAREPAPAGRTGAKIEVHATKPGDHTSKLT